jgi:hypothetical protein
VLEEDGIISTDHVRNEDVFFRVKEQRNILHKIRKRKANLIVQILRRNCLLQRVIEGKIQGGIEVTGRQRRRRRKLVKCYICSIALYGAETWTLRAVDQKHLESFEMWCWRRMKKIS